MHFIDLSNNNPTVNLKQVRAAGYTAVYHKATEGIGFTDPLFQHRRTMAAQAGLRFGAYHFAHPGNNPVAEANHFIEVVRTVGRTDLRPALDYETAHPQKRDHWWIRQFNQHVYARLGVLPVFYSYTSLIKQIRLPVPAGAALWLADYNGKDDVAAPAPWKKVHAHQLTDHGAVPGVAGDCDVSYAPRLRPLLAHPWTGWL